MNTDIAIIGLGPAGRALAHRLTTHGAHVTAYDPHPHRPWKHTLGGWAHQLPTWLPPHTATTRAPTTVIHTNHRAPLFDEYVILDTPALQQALTLDNVTIHTTTINTNQLHTLAPIVIDTRGNQHPPPAHTPIQTAYGITLHPTQAAPLLQDADAVLMDWRPHDGTPTWGHRTASFCYTIPLPNGHILTEETILAATPPIPTTHLAQRLHTRLARHGIHPDPTSTTEHVHIPMLPTTPHHRHPRFGAASHQNNPLTGYSVFASLAAADTAAHTLIHHGHLPPAPPATTTIRRLALNALTRLNGHHTFNLFDAYNHLPAHKQRAIMDPTTNAPTLLNALTTQWANLPPHTRATLIAATTNLTPRHHQDTP